jgi:hypothetical protein
MENSIVFKQLTNDRTEAKIGMNVINAIIVDRATLEIKTNQNTSKAKPITTHADFRIVEISLPLRLPICCV